MQLSVSPTELFKGRNGRVTNDDAGLHMEDFQNALEGKITTEGWDAAKLVDYHKFLVSAAEKEKGEVTGFREAKRAEADRVEKLKVEATAIEDRIRNAKEEKSPENPQMTQFRSEQVEKARQRLFSTVKLTEEEKVVVDEKFKRLDTGKLDADFIYQDYLSAFAAANPTKHLELTQTQQQAEDAARLEIERQAQDGKAPPAQPDLKKFSQEALDLAKKADISPEAATKQVANGMTRVYGEQ